jgi:hypothetical protein
MRTAIPMTVLATTLACSFASAPAYARARVFVASYGNDSNPCTFGSPCKTFQQAVNVVDSGGEVTAIDSAGFGPIIINKPVTITSPDGIEAGIVPNAGSPAIGIDTNGDVFLRGLTIEGNNSGTDGIYLTGGSLMTRPEAERAGAEAGTVATLGIVHCVIRHFTHDGIWLQPTNTLNISILDTIASNNGWHGIELSPSGSGAMAGIIDHSTTISNGFDGMVAWGANTNVPIYGVRIDIANSLTATNGRYGVNAYSSVGNVYVTVRDNTSASANFSNGFEVSGSKTVMIFDNSRAFDNGGAGINIEAGAIGVTFANNHMYENDNGNDLNTSGAWVSLPSIFQGVY